VIVMANFGYSFKPDAGKKVSMAQANDLNASFKDLSQVCADCALFDRAEDSFLEMKKIKIGFILKMGRILKRIW